MEGFAATNLATKGSNRTGIYTNTGTLRNIFHNGRGGGVNGIQAVATFNQHARAELTGWRTYACHDWGWQGDFEGGGRIIEATDIIQTGFLRVFGEQTGRH